MSDEDFEMHDIETHDFASLRDRVELWKREQEAWETIERRGEGMLHLIAAAEVALEEGNPARAEQLVLMVEEDLRDGTVEDWEDDEDLEDYTAAAGEDDEDFENGEAPELETDAEPVPDSHIDDSRYDHLRALADSGESKEDDELDRHVEAQIEKVGYESDAILDGSGIAARIIREKYDDIRDMIDRAEAADKAGNTVESERLLKEAEDLL